MSKYCRIPEEVDAVEYIGDGMVNTTDEVSGVPNWVCRALNSGVLVYTNGGDPFICNTLSGPVTVYPGYYIVRFDDVEMYPYPPEMFKSKFEKV